MDNKQILSLLAMDLKRAALGFHAQSYKTADRFLAEAQKRKAQINLREILPYMQTLLNDIDLLPSQNISRRAEDALLLSTRIQNYVLRH